MSEHSQIWKWLFFIFILGCLDDGCWLSFLSPSYPDYTRVRRSLWISLFPIWVSFVYVVLPFSLQKKNNLSYVLFYLVKAATIQWELRGFYNLTLYFWASNIPIYKTTVFFINIVIPSWFSYCAPRKLRILQRHHRVKYWRKRRGDQAGRGPALSPLHQLGMLCFFSFICEGGFALNHPHSLPWYRYNELTWK